MRRRGFANPELLIVITLAGLVLALLLPMCGRAVRQYGELWGAPGPEAQLLILGGGLVGAAGVVWTVGGLGLLLDAAGHYLRRRTSPAATRLVRAVGTLACLAGSIGAARLVHASLLGGMGAGGPEPLAALGYFLAGVLCLAGARFFTPPEP